MAAQIEKKVLYLSYEKAKQLLKISEEDLNDLIVRESIKPMILLQDDFERFFGEADPQFIDDGNHDDFLADDDDDELKLLEDLLHFDNPRAGASTYQPQWVYLREPLQTGPSTWIFQLASRLSGSQKPVLGIKEAEPDQWFLLEKKISLLEIKDEAVFVPGEIDIYRANQIAEPLNQGDEHVVQVGKPTPEIGIPIDQEMVSFPIELRIAIVAYRAVMNGYGDESQTFKNRLKSFVAKSYPSLPTEAIERIGTVSNNDKSVGRKKRKSLIGGRFSSS